MTTSLARHGIQVPPSEIPAFPAANADSTWTMLQSAFMLLSSRYSTQEDPQELANDAIRSMVASLNDCLSDFSTAQDLQDAQARSGQQFVGIGVTLLNRPGEPLVIKEVFDGGPAAKAKIVSGDIIRRIDDKDVTGMAFGDVRKLIIGQAGTNVQLTLERSSGTTVPVSVTREQISVPDIRSGVLYDSTGRFSIAYLHLYNFGPTLMDVLSPALVSLDKRGVKAWIIDLRDNGGGQIDTLRAVGNEFLAPGPLQQFKDRGGQVGAITLSGNGTRSGMPIVVIVNSLTAGAAEMFAMAVRDQHVGRLVGDRTAGCLGIPSAVSLPNGAAMRFRTATMLDAQRGTPLPNGGVKPDIVATLTTANIIHQQDPQLDAAINEVRSRLRGS
jgi:carboxyl-terminal processing protease